LPQDEADLESGSHSTKKVPGLLSWWYFACVYWSQQPEDDTGRSLFSHSSEFFLWMILLRLVTSTNWGGEQCIGHEEHVPASEGRSLRKPACVKPFFEEKKRGGGIVGKTDL